MKTLCPSSNCLPGCRAVKFSVSAEHLWTWIIETSEAALDEKQRIINFSWSQSRPMRSSSRISFTSYWKQLQFLSCVKCGARTALKSENECGTTKTLQRSSLLLWVGCLCHHESVSSMHSIIVSLKHWVSVMFLLIYSFNGLLLVINSNVTHRGFPLSGEMTELELLLGYLMLSSPWQQHQRKWGAALCHLLKTSH